MLHFGSGPTHSVCHSGLHGRIAASFGLYDSIVHLLTPKRTGTPQTGRVAASWNGELPCVATTAPAVTRPPQAAHLQAATLGKSARPDPHGRLVGLFFPLTALLSADYSPLAT